MFALPRISLTWCCRVNFFPSWLRSLQTSYIPSGTLSRPPLHTCIPPRQFYKLWSYVDPNRQLKPICPWWIQLSKNCFSIDWRHRCQMPCRFHASLWLNLATSMVRYAKGTVTLPGEGVLDDWRRYIVWFTVCGVTFRESANMLRSLAAANRHGAVVKLLFDTQKLRLKLRSYVWSNKARFSDPQRLSV